MSSDGTGKFKILPPAVDVRTKPTGKFAEYPHPHWHATDPEKYPGKPAPEDVPQHRIKKGEIRAFAKYEIHEPEQDAFGDWAAICVGGQYYLFADYHPANDSIRVGWFTSSSIDEPFTFCGEIGKGHPDPDILFAEGKFYLATQMSTDYGRPFRGRNRWYGGVEFFQMRGVAEARCRHRNEARTKQLGKSGPFRPLHAKRFSKPQKIDSILSISPANWS